MKKFLLLLFLILLVACSEKTSNDGILYGKDTPDEDLLQTIKNSYLNSNFIVSTLSGYMSHKHKEEIAKTIKIADTFHISGYNQTLVLYSYSIGSDIFRESGKYKKVDGKWYKTYLYTSSYDDDPFKDGKPSEAKIILEKEDKWNEESEETENLIFGG